MPRRAPPDLLRTKTTMNTRVEHDLLGDMALPADCWHGIQTQRAVENFAITGVPISHFPHFINALAMVKAARPNIKPRPWQRERLRHWERLLRGC